MVYNTVITNAGLNEIRDWLAGSSASTFTHIGYGTGTTEPTAEDTELESEISGIRDSATKTTAFAQVKFTDEVDSTEGNGNTISEIGIFNSSSGGDMLIRSTFVGRPKTTSVNIQTEVYIYLES